MKKIIYILLSSFYSFSLFSQTTNFTIIVTDTPKAISPYIYGANPEFTSNENLAARRSGGNRLTGYNWENNASNAGSDWNHSSDNYLTWVAGISNENQPGIVLTDFHTKALNAGAYSLVTLQMAGYVAKDKSGTVTEAQTAPSSRWNRVQFAKGSAFSLNPNLTDTLVYMDECVNLLVNSFGYANTANGVKGYALDNEPALWPTTHPRIHPGKPTCVEIVQKGVDLAKAVKNVDPYAEIFGPVLYGFAAYNNFQDAADWNTVRAGKGYSWFIDYYLDEMRKADSTNSKRLLDVLDLHWYPEAIGDNRITETYATTAKDRIARVQAPRTLWDPNYKYNATNPLLGENSWISRYFSNFLPLITKIKSSINKYYPGTKLAFTEFTYGGENDISGAIATADVLGIFGKYGVYLATFWPISDNTSYIRSAYRIFRNYDGSKSTFGNASIPSYTSDSVYTSIYGAINTANNKIHLIAINKDFNNTRNANFNILYNSTIISGNVWILDSTSTQIRNAGSINSISNNSFSYTLPAASICHFILQTSNTFTEPNSNNLLPSKLTLHTYPNPFNSSCKIEYTLPDNQIYEMTITDVLGRTVRTYKINSLSGYVTWDGTNENGQLVSSGIYCVIVRGGNSKILSKKIAYVK